MRIVLWNCNNGLGSSEQIKQLLDLHPDVAVIPELKQSNLEELNPYQFNWITNNHTNPKPKGLGIVTFNEISLEVQDRDEDMEIYIPLTLTMNEFRFNLLAVWNFYHACKQGRFKEKKGPECLEFAAINHYSKFLTELPSLVAGDWNLGPTFYQHEFLAIEDMFNKLGLTSLYHQHFNLPISQSQHSTFKGSRGQFHHLDHIFGSQSFQSAMTDFKIVPIEESIRSDHAPVVVDFDLSKLA